MEIPLCMPALIYLIYFVSHVLIDVYRAQYYLATIELIIGVMVTFVLNLLCTNELGAVSWLIVSIPFLLMTVASAMLLMAFNPTKTNENSLVDPYAIPASGRVDFHGVQGKSPMPEQSNVAQEPTPMNTNPQHTFNTAPAPVNSGSVSSPNLTAPLPSNSSVVSVNSTEPRPSSSHTANDSTISSSSYPPASTAGTGLYNSAQFGNLKTETQHMIDKLDTCDIPKNGSCSSCSTSVGRKGGQCMWCAQTGTGSGGICRDVSVYGDEYSNPQKLALGKTTCSAKCEK